MPCRGNGFSKGSAEGLGPGHLRIRRASSVSLGNTRSSYSIPHSVEKKSSPFLITLCHARESPARVSVSRGQVRLARGPWPHILAGNWSLGTLLGDLSVPAIVHPSLSSQTLPGPLFPEGGNLETHFRFLSAYVLFGARPGTFQNKWN